jgi:hypothetical protein
MPFMHKTPARRGRIRRADAPRLRRARMATSPAAETIPGSIKAGETGAMPAFYISWGIK